MDSENAVPAHPAATVILVRDSDKGLEVLLIHRNPKLSFQGGIWAFPGGRVEPGDFSLGDDHDLVAAARRAAVRETEEEVDVRIFPGDLVPVSHWTTPEGSPRRFATWFFAASVENQAVRIDEGETVDSRWFSPEEALDARRLGEIALLPPTFVSVHDLLGYSSAGAALSALSERRIEVFCPRMRETTGGFCQLYEGDVAYEGGNIDQPGPRHRFWGLDTGWWYERAV